MSRKWRNLCGPQLPFYVVGIAVLFTACSTHQQPDSTVERAPYVSLSQLESEFGPLLTAGNHPTPNQAGTGDRLGLFRDPSGTIWGLPLAIEADGSVIGCAPRAVRDASVTDTYPRGTVLIGATNAPTGWRGGTGKLELLLRDDQGHVQWHAVSGSHIDVGPACWAQDLPGPKQRLLYYRLVPTQ